MTIDLTADEAQLCTCWHRWIEHDPAGARHRCRKLNCRCRRFAPANPTSIR